MKPIFIIIVLLLYLVAHVYVGIRIFQVAPAVLLIRWIVASIFILGFASLIVFFVWNDKMTVPVAGFFYQFGTSWLVAFLYIILLVVCVDIFRIMNHFAHFFPKETLYAVFRNNGVTSLIGLGLVALILFLGNMQYHNKKRVHLSIQTDKTTPAMRIVGISDLHLGYTITAKELSRWVEMINAENPDVILIAGDLIDNQLSPLLYHSLDEELLKLRASLGIYACTGNHEYFSGIDDSLDFFEKAGIVLLRDSVVNIEGLTIIGRDDYTSKHRKNLHELTQNIHNESFSILLDHQPHHLDEAVSEGIDFQFSGHTHRGQVFPFSLLVDKMYELSHGYLKKGHTHFYVSSGLGIWGGKFRIGTQSGYLVLDINN